MGSRTHRSKGPVALAVVVILLAGCGGGGSSAPKSGVTRSASTTPQTSTPSQTETPQTNPVADQTLTLNLSASPKYVERRGLSTLSWDASPATRCTASGGWRGDQPVSGVYTVGPVASTTSYELSCENAEASVQERVTVTVVSKVLRWRPPSRNVDGSLLTDLAGYVIYWGVESFNYTDSHRLESPNATQWLVDAPPGSYYIAMTAFDSEGNESAFSNEILKVIP